MHRRLEGIHRSMLNKSLFDDRSPFEGLPARPPAAQWANKPEGASRATMPASPARSSLNSSALLYLSNPSGNLAVLSGRLARAQ